MQSIENTEIMRFGNLVNYFHIFLFIGGGVSQVLFMSIAGDMAPPYGCHIADILKYMCNGAFSKLFFQANQYYECFYFWSQEK